MEWRVAHRAVGLGAIACVLVGRMQACTGSTTHRAGCWDERRKAPYSPIREAPQPPGREIMRAGTRLKDVA